MTRTATFNVVLNQAHSNTITVNYQTVDKLAVAGKDYTAASGTLTFASGELAKTIAIAVQAVSDRALTFSVKLSGEVNCTLATASTGVCSIAADNSLTAKSNDYYSKKASYNTAYSNLSYFNTNYTIALSSYNSTYAYYLDRYTNATNIYNTYAAAQAVTDAALVTSNNAYYAWLTGPNNKKAEYWTYYVADYNAYVAAKAGSDGAINDYNVSISQRDAAYTAYQSALTTLTFWSNGLATAVSQRDSWYDLMNTAKALAIAGFVGSTTLLL